MKMRKLTFFIPFMMLTIFSFGQYQLGHRVVTFTDPSRSDRDIETHMYYPATTAGDDVPVATGTFPVIVMGHGFIMGDPALYTHLWEGIATKGYIMAFPTTENGSIFPPPNHLTFGLDLAFLVDTLIGSNTVASSFLFGKVANKAALLGHSMGGKAAWIAANTTTKATTIFTFGAAISNPPIGTAVDVLGEYAQNVTIPAVSMAAQFDCVAPPAENQKLLYDTASSQCKYYIEIIGGGHCFFAAQEGSGLMACESGEGSCETFTITREQQNQYVLDFLTPWLSFQLKNNAADGLAFKALVASSSLITEVHNCAGSGTEINEKTVSTKVEVFPNPSNGSFNLFVGNVNNRKVEVKIYNLTGSVVFSNLYNASIDNNYSINTEDFNKGIYFIEVNADGDQHLKKLVIN